MKKFFTIRLHLLAILAAITIVSCTSDTVDTEPVIPVTPQTRAIPTPTYERPLSQRRLGVTLQHLRCECVGAAGQPLFRPLQQIPRNPAHLPLPYDRIRRHILLSARRHLCRFGSPNLIAEFFGKGDHRSGRALCNNRLHPNPRLSRQHQPDGGKQMVHDAV